MKDEDAIKERIAHWRESLAEITKRMTYLMELLAGFYSGKEVKSERFSETEFKEMRKAVKELVEEDERRRTVTRLIEELEWILGDGSKG